MKIPAWLSVIGHFIGDIFGGAVGGAIGRKIERQEIPRGLGEAAGKAAYDVLMPDREDVMKALMYYQCASIIKLLEEMNERGGILKIGGRYQYEHKVVNLLLKVKEKDRQWVFTKLNRICRMSREEFFTYLEIMHNDGWKQILSMAEIFMDEKLAKVGEKALEYDRKLQPTLKKLRADVQKEKGRISRWLDSLGL